ncbi:MAG TPA: OmpA family protein [Rhizomicrobium sp.]|jgi:outer membrane protein OmpA-like peptidoglycan-associated protein
MKKSLILLVPLLLPILMLAGCESAPRRYAPPPEPYPYEQRPTQPRPSYAPPQRQSGPYAPPPVTSAGPLRTAAVSAYMDGEENELRARLRGAGIIVARRGDGIVLILPDAALFDGGADLSGRGVDLLRNMALSLRHYDHTALHIEGYTDTAGGADKNIDISDRRAKAVASALASDGVGNNRISAQGYGETNPRIKTGDNVNDPRNRRIEIRITATPVG